MILVCYDGSADAQAAIDRAAQLIPGAETTVLTIWEPFFDAMTHSGSMGMGLGFVGTNVDDQKIDQASQEAALEAATEGAQRATAAGLSPSRGSPAGTAASPTRSLPRRPTWTPTPSF